MVAINNKRVHCVVISVPVSEVFASRGALAHEMVPGADPYVAQLIERLQNEVREERRTQQLLRRESGLVRTATRPRFAEHQLVNDLEIPWFDMPMDDEPLGDDSVTEFGGDGNEDVAPNW
jgi:hypothetical protein